MPAAREGADRTARLRVLLRRRHRLHVCVGHAGAGEGPAVLRAQLRQVVPRRADHIVGEATLRDAVALDHDIADTALATLLHQGRDATQGDGIGQLLAQLVRRNPLGAPEEQGQVCRVRLRRARCTHWRAHAPRSCRAAARRGGGTRPSGDQGDGGGGEYCGLSVHEGCFPRGRRRKHVAAAIRCGGRTEGSVPSSPADC